LGDYLESYIKNTSLAHRISKLPPEEYDKMFSNKKDTDEIVVDHEAQIQKMMRS